MLVRNDCMHFEGDIPCTPHKKTGVHCDGCPEYQPVGQRLLIIKLGAAGDVIRTTPILRALRARYPDAEITWLTHSPIFVPPSYVTHILSWTFENVLWVRNRAFDIVFNLDKDREAIALAAAIEARIKKGYLMDPYGKCRPADRNAEGKWRTGLFDDLSRKNTKSYPEELFEICDLPYQRQEYILELPPSQVDFDLPNDKTIIGLNTGCGTRWLTRLWGNENWVRLSEMLYENGYLPLLLGGPQEDAMNREIAAHSPAAYLGYFDLSDFLHLVDRCRLVITSVTLALHVALAFEKKTVLLNNIFNKNEFELYGLGEILEPEGKACLGCYKNACPEPCMSTIPPARVLDAIQRLL
ncbi:MAG: glycosyltransferase family 9 protein [Candidatus Latescibacteria bacterium]|nr:glycosyltransferase family 9 protein [Candidatus Latescibacterota bacterium]